MLGDVDRSKADRIPGEVEKGHAPGAGHNRRNWERVERSWAHQTKMRDNVHLSCILANPVKKPAGAYHGRCQLAGGARMNGLDTPALPFSWSTWS